jgi:hypothetical protein
MSNKVKFLEESHQYFAEDGRELISVSQFTERFKQKVDWKAIAKKVAAKETKNGNPATTQDILDKWERKRDMSAAVGTLFHSIKEEELIASTPSYYGVQCGVESCPVYVGEKSSIPINELSKDTVYPELMIYDFDYMICGQSDKVIVANDTINIWDFKTDSEIKRKAFSSKWVQPQKLLGPLSHLDDCNFNVYSIKMSLYMYLLWRANKGKLKPGQLIIEHVHLKRDDDGIPVLDREGRPIVEKIENIEVPYRKKEVIAMLETLET